MMKRRLLSAALFLAVWCALGGTAILGATAPAEALEKGDAVQGGAHTVGLFWPDGAGRPAAQDPILITREKQLSICRQAMEVAERYRAGQHPAAAPVGSTAGFPRAWPEGVPCPAAIQPEDLTFDNRSLLNDGVVAARMVLDEDWEMVFYIDFPHEAATAPAGAQPGDVGGARLENRAFGRDIVGSWLHSEEDGRSYRITLEDDAEETYSTSRVCGSVTVVTRQDGVDTLTARGRYDIVHNELHIVMNAHTDPGTGVTQPDFAPWQPEEGSWNAAYQKYAIEGVDDGTATLVAHGTAKGMPARSGVALERV